MRKLLTPYSRALTITQSPSVIRSYSLESIMKSAPGERVESVYKTKYEFSACFENNFLVLPGGKTVVGVNGENLSNLIAENIASNKGHTFGNHLGTINTLLYDQITESLLAGDQYGHVVQYKRKGSGFSLVKIYRRLGLDSVNCSAQVGGFAFFGGKKDFLGAIDIRKREDCRLKKQILFSSSFSLQVCRGPNQKVYLSVGGEKQKSDYFEKPGLLKTRSSFCTG